MMAIEDLHDQKRFRSYRDESHYIATEEEAAAWLLHRLLHTCNQKKMNNKNMQRTESNVPKNTRVHDTQKF